MKNATISVVVSLIAAWTLYTFAPTALFTNPFQKQVFGTTLTTIQGSDTLSASRTTINNNFSALNTGKFELSDWYATTSAAQITTLANLTTVGTIASGIWHGTAVTVPYGGTGSTTLSSDQILLGNGAGNIGVVAGYGTSGQALVSNGSSVPPTWQSISFDNSLAYTNTGLWTFNTGGIIDNASSTFSATTTLSKALVLGTTILTSIYDYQDFTSSGTWNKPAYLSGNEMVLIEIWGAGGGGGKGNTLIAGGGGGGEFLKEVVPASSLASSVTVTVGTGGAGATVAGNTGTTGGDTSFDGVTAHGGAGGTGGASTATGGNGGSQYGTSANWWGAGASAAAGGSGIYSGAGGGADSSSGKNGGNSVDGGAGGAGAGGASGTTFGTAGSSAFGGGGGAAANGTNATDGTAPGGGGGAVSGTGNGGAGARGEVRVWVIK